MVLFKHQLLFSLEIPPSLEELSPWKVSVFGVIPAFSRIRTKYGETLDQNNSEYRHFLRSDSFEMLSLQFELNKSRSNDEVLLYVFKNFRKYLKRYFLKKIILKQSKNHLN